MSKQKYVYNTHSLQFERFKPNFKHYFVRSMGYVCAIVFTSLVLVVVFETYFPSQKQQSMARELDQMKYHYMMLTDQVDMMNKDLESVQDKDASVYRFILGIDPLDESMWEAGVGGTERYQNLVKYSNTGELLIQTQQKVDQLDRRIQIQMASLDSLESQASCREEMMAAIPSIKPVRLDYLKRNINALSGFGLRLHPVHKVKKLHQGIDFTAPVGTDIQATGNGVVTSVRRSRIGYGKHVVIDHGYNYESLYAHMSKIDVKVGDVVTKGQRIGEVGNTGTSTAPHLHYEVRKKGSPVDPIIYCMDDLSPEEYQLLVDRASFENQSFE
ncbi:MAG: M23 family metallopeptidase [Saprospiraceae bacterium]|nr:M23 family metallopeptidase [Saprospiraceae bacterium]